MNDKSNQPLWKDGDIAVWEKVTPGGLKLYTVSEGPKAGPKIYTTIFPKIASLELTPEQAGHLYLGEDVEVKMNGPRGEYAAILGARGVKEEQRVKEGKTYVNHTLDVGMALPLHRKEGGALFGFKVDGVTYFQTVGPQESPITLNASDAIRLAANKPVEKDGSVISLGEIKESELGRTARVNIVPASQQVAEGEEEQEEAMPDLGAGPDLEGEGPDLEEGADQPARSRKV